MITRGTFTQLLAPGLRKPIVQWNDWAMKNLEYTKYFNVETSDRAYEEDIEIAGVPPAVQTAEGVPISYFDPIQGGSKRYTHLKYALGTRITEEALEDDQYGVLKKVPNAHTRSHQFVEEQVAWNVVNNGFTTTTTTDGVSLFNNVHPLLGGSAATSALPLPATSFTTAGTYPNRPATDVDISFTAIQNMVTQFRRLIDGVGMPLQKMPSTIIIPPEQEVATAEILASAYKPGGAQNDINALQKFNLSFATITYLISTTAWFALGPKGETDLNFFRRTGVRTDFSDDFDTNSLKMKTYCRFSVGATTWISTWGSNGP